MARLDVAHSALTNGLLGSLTASDFALLQPSLSAVELPLRRQLESRSRRIEHAYFPISGLASLVANAGANHTIEVGIVGKEGMTGMALLLGSDLAMHETFIQSPGHGWRISADDLAAATKKSPSLHRALLRYIHVMMSQMASTTLANGRFRL